jgi:hypothetical protein
MTTCAVYPSHRSSTPVNRGPEHQWAVALRTCGPHIGVVDHQLDIGRVIGRISLRGPATPISARATLHPTPAFYGHRLVEPATFSHRPSLVIGTQVSEEMLNSVARWAG